MLINTSGYSKASTYIMATSQFSLHEAENLCKTEAVELKNKAEIKALHILVHKEKDAFCKLG